MKRIMALGLLLFAVTACEKDPEPNSELPEVQTSDVLSVGNVSARIQCPSLCRGAVKTGIIWGNSSSLSGAYKEEVSTGDPINLYNLRRSTTYYYRACATDCEGNTIRGEVRQFTTKSLTAPRVWSSIKYTGYASSNQNPFRFTVSASAEGIDCCIGWGVELSLHSDFSYSSVDSFDEDCYVEGDMISHATWGSRSSGRLYFRSYAVLPNGRSLYGDTNWCYLGS